MRFLRPDACGKLLEMCIGWGGGECTVAENEHFRTLQLAVKEAYDNVPMWDNAQKLFLH